MDSFERTLRAFEYAYPAERVAQEPARPRDAARLLAYDRKTGRVSFAHFRDIGAYLPKGAVLVFNDTKVLPARLELRKETGGRVRVLYMRHRAATLWCLADRALKAGDALFLRGKLFGVVQKKDGNAWAIRLKISGSEVISTFERYGMMPLPPYINASLLTERERRQMYQTVFAKTRGSIAAPTASLHFTKRLISRLCRDGFGVEYVTLHVGLGTFAPITPDQLKRKALHRERYSIDARTKARLNAAKRAGRPIIAVGTTVARALETSARARGHLARGSGTTDLFIRERDRIRFVDGLVTNFHVPRSSLMMLVSAFIGRQMLLDLYRTAIRKRFRLFSFGDGMLIV